MAPSTTIGLCLLRNVVRSHSNNCNLVQICRTLASQPDTSFKFSDLTVRRAVGSECHAKPPTDNLQFGHHYSDHMLEIDWSVDSGWGRPRIEPIHNLSLHPGAKVFHYAIELFEGVKAYRGVDGKIRIFRPMMNMRRMRRTAKRASLPDFDCAELLKCMSELVHIDEEWVPQGTSSSLYIRPTMIGTDPTLGISTSRTAKIYVITGPVGSYYDPADGCKPITLLADGHHVRAFIGGPGAYKLGSNYAPTILISTEAQALGCQQVLWLYGNDEKLTEVGTMNIFAYLTNERGEKELVTPPLDDGLILPGVTRDSILTLAREWAEFKVSERYLTMGELRKAVDDGRMHELFGAGTAAVVAPVDRILHKQPDGSMDEVFIPTMTQKEPVMPRFADAINDIQYGVASRPDWQHDVC